MSLVDLIFTIDEYTYWIAVPAIISGLITYLLLRRKEKRSYGRVLFEEERKNIAGFNTHLVDTFVLIERARQQCPDPNTFKGDKFSVGIGNNMFFEFRKGKDKMGYFWAMKGPDGSVKRP